MGNIGQAFTDNFPLILSAITLLLTVIKFRRQEKNEMMDNAKADLETQLKLERAKRAELEKQLEYKSMRMSELKADFEKLSRRLLDLDNE